MHRVLLTANGFWWISFANYSAEDRSVWPNFAGNLWSW